MAFAKVFFAYFTINIITQLNAIRCYNCAVTTEIVTIGNKKTVTPSCAHFDGSPTYIVDCPYSTMCSRIISTMYLRNSYEQKTITLGCAQQKLLRHVLYNGKWKEEHSIEEIYSEDCKTMNDNNLVGASRTYCYCRENLCNSGNRHYLFTNLFSFILTLLIIKTTF